MKYVLLISGYKSAGKTESTKMIKNMLVASSYTLVTTQKTGQPQKDRLYLLEGNTSKGKAVRIVINTASDDLDAVKRFNDFLANNPCDVIITAVRDYGKERTNILDVVDCYTTPKDFKLEVPLAKINKHRSHFKNVLAEYKKTLKKLIGHILRSNPFDLNV